MNNIVKILTKTFLYLLFYILIELVFYKLNITKTKNLIIFWFLIILALKLYL